jgi:hypothetical protein
MKRKVPWIRLSNNVKSWPENRQDVLLWLRTKDIVQAHVTNTDKLYFEDLNGDDIEVYDVYAWMPIWFVLPRGLNTETYEQLEMEEEWIV